MKKNVTKSQKAIASNTGLLFNNVAIIGVGLLGGSIALAIKKHQLANKIIGCSSTNATIDKAKTLKIIDSGTIIHEDAIADADLVIICTPLSTYGDIIGKISAKLKKDAILTDVGSVKNIPTQVIMSCLNRDQQKNFVPSHPIAGTELSGPEAAFDSLFENKTVIFTNTGIDNKAALQKMQEFWQRIGAKTEIMDSVLHDEIYATTSHLIQIIASSFAYALSRKKDELVHEIIKNGGESFKKFIRLSGSDPIMWRDIFLLNKVNLLKLIKNFGYGIKSLRDSLGFGERTKISFRLNQAKEKYLKLAKIKGKKEENYSSKEGKINFPVNQEIWIYALPMLISCLILEEISEDIYQHSSGTGFYSLTENITSHRFNELIPGKMEQVLSQKETIIQVLEDCKYILDLFTITIEQDDQLSLQDILTKSRNIYKMVY